MESNDLTRPSPKRRIVGTCMHRSILRMEELPSGDFCITDESGTRTISRDVFMKNYMLVGQPEYV